MYAVEQEQRTPMSTSFGQWFIDKTKVLNMTQAEIARHMGVSRHTIGRWSRDEFLPSPKACAAMAKVMGLDPNEVLAAAGYVTEMDDERQAVMDLVRYLPEERLREAARYLRFLVRERGEG